MTRLLPGTRIMKASFLAGFFLVLAPLPALAGTCLKLSGDRISVRDLLPAAPGLQVMDPNQVLGYAPAPGATRIVRRAELARWTRDGGLRLDPASLPAAVCLERATTPVTAADIRAAIDATLHNAGGGPVDIRIVDFSRFSLPPSRLEFPLSGLGRPSTARPDAPVLWLGSAIFDGGRHRTVWATVVLRETRKVLVAAEPIPARQLVAPGATRVEESAVFPYPPAPELTPGDIAGRALRRPVAAGRVITRDLLVDLPAIQRGEQASVTVRDGPIRILLDAQADSSGARGDAIVLVNPASGKKFRGTIVERRQVLVQLSGGST
ncbi:MAG TPA: flagellar basal body P-ring formation chaperone FlgA [Bryobacteraceae bacterium]|nr:flagellar basal body P-ring formation chaperone FlgA [Bryobacteraceae bacterium]